MELDSCAVLPAETEMSTTHADALTHTEPCDLARTDHTDDLLTPTEAAGSADSSAAPSSALQINKASVLSLEDPVKMMDSILNENGAISQNINLLGK